MHITDNGIVGRVRIQAINGRKRFVVGTPVDEVEQKFVNFVYKVAVMAAPDIRENTPLPWIALMMLHVYIMFSLLNMEQSDLELTKGKRLAVDIYLTHHENESRQGALRLLSLWDKGILKMPVEYPYTLEETKQDLMGE